MFIAIFLSIVLFYSSIASSSTTPRKFEGILKKRLKNLKDESFRNLIIQGPCFKHFFGAS